MKANDFFQDPLKLAVIYRSAAKFIDFLIALSMAIVAYPLGVLAGFVYLSLKDAMGEGASLGKRLLGFRVLSLVDGLPCRPKQSFMRNLIFSIPFLFTIVPVWGWPFFFLFLSPLVVVEVFFILKGASGHRLGDMIAQTTVIANDPTSQVIKKIKTSWFSAEDAEEVSTPAQIT